MAKYTIFYYIIILINFTLPFWKLYQLFWQAQLFYKNSVTYGILFLLLNSFFMRSKFKNILFAVLFIFFAAAPLMWYRQADTYTLLGSGDNLSLFNLGQYFYSQFFVYNPFLYDGINISFIIAQFMPEVLFFTLFETFAISPVLTTLFFLFFILLTSEISMFFYLRYILLDKFKINNLPVEIVCFFGGVFYALSPYLIPLIEPGQYLQLILYATTPMILLLFDNILTVKDYDIKKFIYLFFLFFFNAASFANIGMMYVLMVLLCLYFIR